MKLRLYQDILIEQARQSLKSHRSSLLVAATGAGKTALTVHMMKTAAERGHGSIFCVHRDTLLSQTSKALWQQKVQHGIIAAGRTMSREPVQVASVQTLVRRLDRVQAPKLIIIDEAHRAAANTYRKILAHYPEAKIIGLTATPQRTDGKGLADVFDDLVLGPSVNELIQQGWLCGYQIFAPPSKAEFKELRKRLGDFAADEVEKMMDKPSITGDSISHYLKYANRKRCVVFCATIKHALHVCEAYNDAGIPAEHIDADTPGSERQAILKRFASGETLVLTNVELVIEGVDVPAIEAVQWLRPTASLIIWMQGNGRGFRPADGKRGLIILDHVENYKRHGLPDDEREWSLEGDPERGKRKKQPDDEFKIKQCEKCYAIYKPTEPECPECGHKNGVKERRIEVVEGELRELDITALRKEQRREQGKAGTLKDLVELGKRRKLKDPSGWAAHVYSARSGRKPTSDLYQLARSYL